MTPRRSAKALSNTATCIVATTRQRFSAAPVRYAWPSLPSSRSIHEPLPGNSTASDGVIPDGMTTRPPALRHHRRRGRVPHESRRTPRTSSPAAGRGVRRQSGPRAVPSVGPAAKRSRQRQGLPAPGWTPPLRPSPARAGDAPPAVRTPRPVPIATSAASARGRTVAVAAVVPVGGAVRVGKCPRCSPRRRVRAEPHLGDDLGGPLAAQVADREQRPSGEPGGHPAHGVRPDLPHSARDGFAGPGGLDRRPSDGPRVVARTWRRLPSPRPVVIEREAVGHDAPPPPHRR